MAELTPAPMPVIEQGVKNSYSPGTLVRTSSGASSLTVRLSVGCSLRDPTSLIEVYSL